MSVVEHRFGLVSKPLTETLRTALLERARGLQIEPSEYAVRLSGSVAETEELAELVGRLLLGHTHFYRHGRVWKWLADNLKEVATRAPVRALVAGCSTGEEAYTLAALLASTYGLNGFEVTAVDVNPKALQHARHGTYLMRDVSKLPEGWQRRYLERSGDGTVRFHAALRSHVRFTWCNLTEGPPGGPYHLIMIRNVLTYMTPLATATILERLLKAMAKPGLLVVAPHETFLVSEHTHLLTAADALPIFHNDSSYDGLCAQSGHSPDEPGAPVDLPLDLPPLTAPECLKPALSPVPPQVQPPEDDHSLRPTTAVLHQRSAVWTELSDRFREFLRTRPPRVVVDLSAVLRIDNQVQQSIRAAVRLLEAAGVRVELLPGPALRRERD